MEDKHIFKGEYCYSFRLDIDWKDSQNIDVVNTKLQEYFTRYRLAQENKKDGTPHLQGILWRDTPLGKIQPQQIRTFFKQRFKLKRGGHSLTSAKKVKSLAAYCSDKEQKGYHDYNIPDNIDLGKWENKEAEKEILKQQLIEKYREYKSGVYTNGVEYDIKWPLDTYEDEKNVQGHLAMIALDVYLPKQMRPPPMKTLLWLALIAGLINKELYVRLNYRLY